MAAWPAGVSFSSRKGRTDCSNMGRISPGTPGMAASHAPPTRQANPAAVPRGLGKTTEPSGKRAWVRWAGLGSRPKLRSRSSTWRRAAGSSTSRAPAARATAPRVRSSAVGPRPPLMTISSLSAPARTSSS